MNRRISAEQDRWNTLQNQPEVKVLTMSQVGFTPAAEVLNGRLAMMGFVILLALSVMVRHNLLDALLAVVDG